MISVNKRWIGYKTWLIFLKDSILFLLLWKSHFISVSPASSAGPLTVSILCSLNSLTCFASNGVPVSKTPSFCRPRPQPTHAMSIAGLQQCLTDLAFSYVSVVLGTLQYLFSFSKMIKFWVTKEQRCEIQRWDVLELKIMAKWHLPNMLRKYQQKAVFVFLFLF